MPSTHAVYIFTVLVLSIANSSSSFADSCPDGQHWDAGMEMCMPNDCPSSQHWDDGMKMCMPDPAGGGHSCPTDQHWDDGMHMCMPDTKGSTTLDFHLNQYAIGITESGPRGRTDFSAPNMFMLGFEHAISDCNSVKVDWMGTTDLWTVPAKGTPQILQVGEANQQGAPFVDAQHPHSSPIMGLTFAVIHCMGDSGQKDKKLTMFFSPRGEATAGPEAFMHRASAEGNPNAPLSHHLQDFFHIMSTVLGAKFDIDKWTIEGSVFSGYEPSPTAVNLDVHPMDSAAIRIGRKIGDHVRVGGSVATVLETQQPRSGGNGQLTTAPANRTTAVSAWVMTDHQWQPVGISTSTIWGQSGEDDVRLNSFLNELLFRFGDDKRNGIFTRVEVVQRTPLQLELNIAGDARHPEWVTALTVGYERKFYDNDDLAVFLGGSYTKSFVPDYFQVFYGGNPNSGEIHLRVQFKAGKSWGGSGPRK